MSEKLELWAISGRVIDDNDDTVHLVWGKTDGDAEDKFKKLLAAEIENDETSESEDDADLPVYRNYVATTKCVTRPVREKEQMMTKDRNPFGFVPVAQTVDDEVMVSMTMEEWAEEFKPFRNANKNGIGINGCLDYDASAEFSSNAHLFRASIPGEIGVVHGVLEMNAGDWPEIQDGKRHVWSCFEIVFKDDDTGEEVVTEFVAAGHATQNNLDESKLLGYFVTAKPYDPQEDYLISTVARPATPIGSAPRPRV